jgi:hypothetical protein
VAEKLMLPPRARGAVGANTMRIVQDAPGARAVTPGTQSVPVGVWVANSLLVDVTLSTPLVCWPVFVIVKVCTALGDPSATDPKLRLVVPPEESAAGEL